MKSKQCALPAAVELKLSQGPFGKLASQLAASVDIKTNQFHSRPFEVLPLDRCD